MSSSWPDGDDQRVDVHDVDDDAALEVPEPPVTGDDAVDAVTAALARAASGPLEEHVPAFDGAHRTLQDRLADVEG